MSERERAAKIRDQFVFGNSAPLSVRNTDEAIVDAMLAYAAECVAAARKRCAYIAGTEYRLMKDTEAAHYRLTNAPFKMQDFGFNPERVELSRLYAHAIEQEPKNV